MPVLQQLSMLACNSLSFTGIYAHLSKPHLSKLEVKMTFHCTKLIFEEVFANCKGCIKYCYNKPRTQHDIIKNMPLGICEDTSH